MHEVLVNRLGGLSLSRKSVVRLTDRPDMTLDVYRGRKTTMQQQQQQYLARDGPLFNNKNNNYSCQANRLFGVHVNREHSKQPVNPAGRRYK